MIKLYKGADNSIIYGLNITVDTDAKNYTGADNLPLWPILAIQVSNITIKDNYIRNNATNSHALGLGDVFHSTTMRGSMTIPSAVMTATSWKKSLAWPTTSPPKTTTHAIDELLEFLVELQ